jgi:putative membrane protein
LRKLSDYILLNAKGVAMGAADAIPGVSGGTIAFITGIYDELLMSIRAFDIEAIKLATSFRVRELWTKINGNFLLVLVSGLAVGVILNLILIDYLLRNHPIAVWSFFFGLILVSAPLILREIKKWDFRAIVMLLIGIALAYMITVLTPTSTPNDLWFIFLCGAIAICAMILPGISGAFILLLLGKYQYVATAVKELDIVVIIVFIAGCVTGLLSFVRFLTWILKNYHNATVALLAGFMVGSLNKVWPWREVVEYTTNSKGEQIPAFDRSILPWDYFNVTGKDPQIFLAIMLMALGVFIVVLIEKLAARHKNKI